MPGVNGRGQPAGLAETMIPLFGRILCLAQTFEVFMSAQGLSTGYEVIRAWSGTWFDPDLVRLPERSRW